MRWCRDIGPCRVVRSRQSYLRIAALSQALRAVVVREADHIQHLCARTRRTWVGLVGWLKRVQVISPVCFLI